MIFEAHNHLPTALVTKVLAMKRAFSPWSMGTKCPALLTVRSSNSPTSLTYPATFPPTFQVLNSVSLSHMKFT